MKVILLQDVRGVGRRFEVKDVPQGHALNFLIPRKMAEPATAERVRAVSMRAEAAAEGTALAEEQFKAALQKLSDRKIELPAQANEKGKLFESIKADDICARLAKEGITLSPGQVALEAPIKNVGEHEIRLRLGALEGVCILSVTSK